MINGFMGLGHMLLNKHVEPQFGGWAQYLTIIGLFGSVTVMALSGLCDMLPAVWALKSLKRALLLFALPVEIVISAIYWPIVIFAPHLMFPRNPAVDQIPEPTSSNLADQFLRIPMWMDLSLHALPAGVLLLDFFILEKPYKPPHSTYGAMILATTFGISYSLWAEYCAIQNGKFAYPFLTIMDLPGRVGVYMGSIGLALGVFWGLNSIRRMY